MNCTYICKCIVICDVCSEVLGVIKWNTVPDKLY